MTVHELHLRVIYLNHLGETIANIAADTGYSESTVRTYIRKYRDLLAEALGICDEYLQTHTPTVEPTTGHCAYLVYVNDGSNNLYAKVGYAGDFAKRAKGLARSYGGVEIVPKHIFYFDSRNIAESMENYMREYYTRKHPDQYIKMDRFDSVRFCKEDIEHFEQIAQRIRELFSMEIAQWAISIFDFSKNF